MNILVIGSGGREHAIIKAFSDSKSAPQIYCAPGNAGIAQLAKLLNLNIKNHSEIIQACEQYKIDFVFVGPEDPLVDGLSDSLRDKKIAVFGPSKSAAQLEGSKIFAKLFMKRAQVPTAHSVTVTSVQTTLESAKYFTAPYILKADGLAAGKGVFICADVAELKNAAENLFDKKILGIAGRSALLEQHLPGHEISFLIFTNGKDFECLPLAQDHKRLRDNNEGPNTGGMGAIAPMPVDKILYEKIIDRVVKPSVQQLEKDNLLFRGVLFIGLMITDNEPYVLEYNVRFGDPETQVILPLIKNDLVDTFFKLTQGELQKLSFNNLYSFCIVNAAEGYPDKVVKNTPIELPEGNNNAYILHAGTALNSNQKLISSGGRVLNILALGNSLKEARAEAYKLNEKISMPGRQFRNDIGNYF
jgi:phosphoribosylamine--glycine ligase